ncbi:TPA_asm: M [Mentha alphacytorhabdovirus 1]|nr:TPA_asm: M [Mentha alphacytorhabdovirus 1]
MDSKWMCVTINSSCASIEIAGKKKPRDFKKGSIIKEFIGLAEQVMKDDKECPHLLRNLFKKGRVSVCQDVHVSAYFGPRTSRMQFLFASKNVFPVKHDIQERTSKWKADGMTHILEGKKIRACVDVTMIVTEVPSSEIGRLLKEKSEWFCGELCDNDTGVTDP